MAAWNHTAHYHEVLLRAVPRACRRALDVGCGQGEFTRRLAERVEQVEAIDSASAVVSRARTLSAGLANICFIDAEFLTYPLEVASYDFVSALAVLHHLPWAEAIEKMKRVLRPGGVLAVLGLFRDVALTDYLLSIAAVPVSRFYRLTRGLAEVGAPIRAPSMTWDEIRRQAAALLPGVVLQRHLLWRYSLIWVKPNEG